MPQQLYHHNLQDNDGGRPSQNNATDGFGSADLQSSGYCVCGMHNDQR
jgi:hypothetical protein